MQVYLVLQNGEVFEGKSFGASGDTVGELVFTTGMNGVIETLTDPCYYGQIVIQTFPIIGNYGIINEDTRGRRPVLSGYIVREYCDSPSNFRCDMTLDAYLKANNIIGLYDIDTRELTAMIREAGVMNAKITTDISAISDILREIRMHTIENPLDKLTTENSVTYGKGKRMVVLNLGAAEELTEKFVERGYEVVVLPPKTSAQEILELRPMGVALCGGAGDPQEYRTIISEVALLAEKKIPMFGMGLGHQILALAMGGHTRKMKYGHRGDNQPVKEIASGRVFVTNQNHGYQVTTKSLPKCAAITYTNVNDASCEGVEYDGYPIMSVQFNIKKGAKCEDTTYICDKFVAKMEEVNYAKR